MRIDRIDFGMLRRLAAVMGILFLAHAWEPLSHLAVGATHGQVATEIRSRASDPVATPTQIETKIRAMADQLIRSTVSIETEDGLGSGTIIDAFGHILTSAHVVEGCQSVRVVLFDARRFNAVIVGTNTTADLAVIKIRADDLSIAKIGNPEKIAVGDWVVTAGHPTSLFADCRPALSVGWVGSVNGTIKTDVREKVFVNTIVSDAAISPGSSGGGLFNLDGELIAVNAAVTSRETRGYAVRITEFLTDRARLLAGENFKRAPDARGGSSRDSERGSRTQFFNREMSDLKAWLEMRQVDLTTNDGLYRGTIVSAAGDVLTSSIPFVDAAIGSKFTASMGKTKEVRQAELIAVDQENEVALLRLPLLEDAYDHVDLKRKSSVSVGTLAFAIDYNGFVGGIVSAINRVPPLELTGDIFYPEVTQVDLRLGSSAVGGGVVDREGRPIGMILQHRLQRPSDRSRSGPYGAFVLPVDRFVESFDFMRKGRSRGPRSEGLLGVDLSDLDAKNRKELGIDVGVLVERRRWWPDGPANKAGIKPGDVIVAIGGHPVVSRSNTILKIKSFKKGDRVSVRVRRDGIEREFEVVMADQSDHPKPERLERTGP